MKLKKLAIIVLTGLLFFALTVPTYASSDNSSAMDGNGSLPYSITLPAGADEPTGVEPKSEPDLIDDGRQLPISDGTGSGLEPPDYKNSIREIQAYINENISDDIYASLHIDRDTEGKEIVVLSFTQAIQGSQKDDILSLADNPSIIDFRIVDYSEKELTKKQREIADSWDGLGAEGIKIYHTGINVFTNRVEIGVDPYNEDTITKLHQAFGSEMIDVVQGYEVQLLGDMNDAARMEATNEVVADNSPNLFQRIVNFFKSVFDWILK